MLSTVARLQGYAWRSLVWRSAVALGEPQLVASSLTEAPEAQEAPARLLVRAAEHAATVAQVVEIGLPDAAIVRAVPARHIHHACLVDGAYHEQAWQMLPPS